MGDKSYLQNLKTWMNLPRGHGALKDPEQHFCTSEQTARLTANNT